MHQQTCSLSSALPPVSVNQVFSSRKTKRKSARFRVGDCCLLTSSLSTPLRVAFAFSVFLCPQSHKPPLRLAVLPSSFPAFPPPSRHPVHLLSPFSPFTQRP